MIKYYYPFSILSLFLALILICCPNKQVEAQFESSKVYEIDLRPDSYHSAEKPKNSLFFRNVEYVALETTEKCRIKDGANFYASENFIFSVASQQILQFDRDSGKFIRELLTYGESSTDFTSTLPNVQSTDSNEFIVLNSQGLSKVNAITRNVVKIGPRPKLFHDIAILNPNLLVSFVSVDEKRTESHLSLLSEQETEITRFYLNKSNHDPGNLILSLGFQEGNFYHFNEKVYFKQVYNDTIYNVSKKGLKEYAYFNLGEFRIDWNKDLKSQDVYKKISILNTYESEEYIFFMYRYRASIKYGVYSKKHAKTYIPGHSWMEDGFVDDIIDFIDFRPRSINDRDELIASFMPREIIFFLNSYGDEKSIPKLLQGLKKVKEGDNPVIGIASLK